MKSYFSATAAALSAMIMAAAMVGCGDNGGNSSSDGDNMVGAGLADGDNDVAENDLPYGSTIVERSKEVDENIEIKIAFDRRYFIEDIDNPDYSEIYKIHDYVKAINTKDGDLLDSVYYPGYLAYGAETNSYDSEEDYINSFFNSIEDALGEGFEINYIDVSNCLLESDSEAKGYFDARDEALAKIAGDDILSKVTSRKAIEIGGYTSYSQAENSYQLVNHADPLTLCVYMIDGQAYIM